SATALKELDKIIDDEWARLERLEDEEIEAEARREMARYDRPEAGESEDSSGESLPQKLEEMRSYFRERANSNRQRVIRLGFSGGKSFLCSSFEEAKRAPALPDDVPRAMTVTMDR